MTISLCLFNYPANLKLIFVSSGYAISGNVQLNRRIMEIKTNVTLLIPTRKIYCEFEINLDRVPITGNPMTDGDYAGTWNEITYKVTPVRQGYAKFNFFTDSAGDAYFDKGTADFNLFFFKFGTSDNTNAAKSGTNRNAGFTARLFAGQRIVGKKS